MPEAHTSAPAAVDIVVAGAGMGGSSAPQFARPACYC